MWENTSSKESPPRDEYAAWELEPRVFRNHGQELTNRRLGQPKLEPSQCRHVKEGQVLDCWEQDLQGLQARKHQLGAMHAGQILFDEVQ